MQHRVKGDDGRGWWIAFLLYKVPVGATGSNLFREASPLLLAVLLFGLTACGTAPVGSGHSSESDFDRGDNQTLVGGEYRPAPPEGGSSGGRVANVGDGIAGIALKMKGVPYLYGGATPAGFDCSGLVQYAYARAGIQVPRNSRAQFAAATRISQEQAEPGDLLFFTHRDQWHVAIYLGRDKFVHAPWPGTSVSTASLRDDFYREKLVAVGRLTPQ